MSDQVQDIMSDPDFEDLLEQAGQQAGTGWEQDFCSDMKSKFAQYGGTMYLSERQLEVLQRIAG